MINNDGYSTIAYADTDRLPASGVDLEAAERAVRMLLTALNIPSEDVHLQRTPRR